MKLYVAYVLLERGMGGKVLGIRVKQSHAKQLCQIDADDQTEEGSAPSLEWSTFNDQETIGIQAVTVNERQYYVEEAELELASREDDSPRMDWKDRKILSLMIDNGWLAQTVQEAHNMVKPLEERQAQLSRYIDTLLGQMGTKQINFKDIDGNEELWEVKK